MSFTLSTEINLPASGSFFCLAVGQRPALVSLQVGEKQVIFKKRGGVRGSYLLQTSFHFITEEAQRRKSAQVLTRYNLVVSMALLSALSYEESPTGK